MKLSSSSILVELWVGLAALGGGALGLASVVLEQGSALLGQGPADFSGRGLAPW